jgi:hypothetical protein
MATMSRPPIQFDKIVYADTHMAGSSIQYLLSHWLNHTRPSERCKLDLGLGNRTSPANAILAQQVHFDGLWWIAPLMLFITGLLGRDGILKQITAHGVRSPF